MAFITLGLATELQIKVPTNGSTGYGDVMRTDTFLKIAEHLHTGSGDGAQLGAGSLLANAVTGAKFRLDNDEYLRSLDSLSVDIDILKITPTDDLHIDPVISKLNLKNLSFLTARNNADSADINILNVDASAANEAVNIEYKIIRGTDVQSGTLEIEQSNGSIVDSYIGDDTGITFSLVADALSFISTSTGNAATITHTIIKR